MNKATLRFLRSPITTVGGQAWKSILLKRVWFDAQRGRRHCRRRRRRRRRHCRGRRHRCRRRHRRRC